ncbi:MAG: S8 family serine peptidase [bacterium]
MKKLFLIILLLVIPFYVSSGQQLRNYVANQMIIQFDPTLDMTKFQKDHSDINFNIIRPLSKRLNIWLVEFDDAKITPESALLEMKRNTEVKVVQHNHFVSERSATSSNPSNKQNATTSVVPNDLRFQDQWALHNRAQTGGTVDADIDAPEAWDIASDAVSANGDVIVMAIIDSQFDFSAPDLNFFVNSLEIQNNGIDDDLNGYIDDYKGWNAYNSSGTMPSPVTNSHGTSVSGVAGASTNNGTGVASISWGAKILPIAGSSATEDIVVEAYGYAYEMRALYNETNGAKGAFVVVTNSSFGVDQGQPEDFPLWCAMYDSLGTVGVLSVGGAPNSSWDVEEVGDIPTRCTSQYFIGVTNTDHNDLLNATAGYGNISIDLGAPGTNVLTTVLLSNYINVTGTSIATPHVTGTIALMYSAATVQLLNQYDDAPDQLALYMRMFLLSNIDPITSLNGLTATGGRLNAHKATLAATVMPDATPPTRITDLAISNVLSDELQISFTAPDDATVFGVTAYDIRYSINPITNETDFQNATRVTYNTPPLAPGSAEFISISPLNFGTPYYIAIKSFDIWDNASEISNVILGTTWGAPNMNVDPLSILNIVNLGVTLVDTIRISNTTAYLSSLDYSVQLTNNTFPFGTVNLRVKPERKDNSIKNTLPKGTKYSDGEQTIYGSGGPDIFGYEWIDSDDPDGPAYIWDDISTTGTEVTSWTASSGSSSAVDDGYSDPINIGFTFKYYNNSYTQVHLNTNGLVMFSPFTGSTTTHLTIPNAIPPNDFIAPIWGDLDGSQNGHVYYQLKVDKFIIQYTNWRYFGSSNYLNFQVVLNQNGRILCYYKQVDNSNNHASVGIENYSGADGLQVSSNSNYLKPNLAILYSAEPEWLNANNADGRILNGNTAKVELEFTSSHMPQGNYSMDAVITSNDPSKTVVTVKVEMIVTSTGSITRNVELNSGWNIISIPVVATDMSVATLFPTATSQAFAYTGTYTAAATLANGVGYWLKFASASTVPITGTLSSATISLNAGWNIIGPFERYVDVSKITTTPAGILSSDFFGYNNVYYSENLLEPGRGYWIKATQAGTIKYNATSANDEFLSKEPLDENTSGGLVEVPMVASDGVSEFNINLYAGIDPAATSGIDKSLDEPNLPPVGPGFDARFVSTDPADYFESYRDYKQGGMGTTGEFTHRLNYRLESGSKGLTLTFTIPAGVSMNIKDLMGGSLINKTYGPGAGTFSNPLTATMSGLDITLTYDGSQMPIQFTSFAAVNEGLDVLLTWKTTAGTNNKGFEIERRSENNQWSKIGFVEGIATKEETQYAFSDKAVNIGGKEVHYRLKQINYDGSVNYSEEIKVEIVPQQFVLEQNYPNPFNPTTTIRYALPNESAVKLVLYNALGQKVDELVNKVQPAGFYEVQWKATNYASGIYIYVIEANAVNGATKDFRAIKKMLLVK